MAKSDEKLSKILMDYLENNQSKIKCPICQNNKLSLGGKYRIDSIEDGDGKNTHMPLFAVYCLNCTNIMLFPTLILEKFLKK